MGIVGSESAATDILFLGIVLAGALAFLNLGKGSTQALMAEDVFATPEPAPEPSSYPDYHHPQI